MRVAIIGAGISGLLCIKACLEEDLEPVCYERNSEIGGFWYERQKQGQGFIHKHSTKKSLNLFSDFTQVNYSNKKNYIDEYTNYYQLNKFISLNHTVITVTKPEKVSKEEKWMVRIQNDAGLINYELFDAVLICSGRKPTKGHIRYQGRVKHIWDQIDDEILDKKVAVIGGDHQIGNMADHVSDCANQVWLAVDSDYSFTATKSTILATSRSIASRGQRKDTDGKMSILLTTELSRKISEGKVIVKSIEDVKENKVVFSDDSTAVPDLIYVCRSEPNLPFLSEIDESVGLYHNLAIMGSAGRDTNTQCDTMAYELEARWVVKIFKGEVKPPDVEMIEKGQGKRRQSVEDNLLYCDTLAEKICCLPNLRKMALTDPYLAYIVWCGPPFSCHYRLFGPHSSPEARRNAIQLYKTWRKDTGRFQWKKVITIGTIAILTTSLSVMIWHAGPYPE